MLSKYFFFVKRVNHCCALEKLLAAYELINRNKLRFACKNLEVPGDTRSLEMGMTELKNVKEKFYICKKKQETYSCYIITESRREIR